MTFSYEATGFLVQMYRAHSKVADKFSINQCVVPRGSTSMMVIDELTRNLCIEETQRDYYRFTDLGYQVAMTFVPVEELHAGQVG